MLSRSSSLPAFPLPLFSSSYELLFPQPLSFDTDLSCPIVCPLTSPSFRFQPLVGYCFQWLTHSLAHPNFATRLLSAACALFAKNHPGGAPPQCRTTHVPATHSSLSFHHLTNPFFSNPFPLSSLQIARGYPLASRIANHVSRFGFTNTGHGRRFRITRDATAPQDPRIHGARATDHGSPPRFLSLRTSLRPCLTKP